MKELVPLPRGIPEKFRLPDQPPALAAYTGNPAAESWNGFRDTYPPDIQGLARQALAVLAPYMTVIGEDALLAWLAPLMTAVRNPGRDDVKTWFTSVLLACSDAPACVFTRESQMRALREIQFFPSAADIYNVVARDIWLVRIYLQRLEIISEGQTE